MYNISADLFRSESVLDSNTFQSCKAQSDITATPCNLQSCIFRLLLQIAGCLIAPSDRARTFVPQVATGCHRLFQIRTPHTGLGTLLNQIETYKNQ